MLVWLASYPRSGSHLIRTLLRNSFDLKSYDVHQSGESKLAPAEAELIGNARFSDPTVEAFLHRARNAPDLHLVKTHDTIPSGDRCIYIVRDGRAALYSYHRYLNEILHSPLPLEQIVRGQVWGGSWARHVERFFDRDPEQTLILRYEDLASPTPPLERIAAFLNVEVKRPFSVPFSRMHALDPVRYNRGGNHVGVRAVEERCSVEFWYQSWEAMALAGYEAREHEASSGWSDGRRRLASDWKGPTPHSRHPEENLQARWAVVSGFDPMEGPFPELGLEEPFYWVVGGTGVIEVNSEIAGERTFSLRLGSLAREQEVTIHGPDQRRTVVQLIGDFGKEEAVSFQAKWSKGPNVVRIEPSAFVATPEGRRLGVTVHEAFFDCR